MKNQGICPWCNKRELCIGGRNIELVDVAVAIIILPIYNAGCNVDRFLLAPDTGVSIGVTKKSALAVCGSIKGPKPSYVWQDEFHHIGWLFLQVLENPEPVGKLRMHPRGERDMTIAAQGGPQVT